jgi:ankyrin repeat protein
LHWAVHCHQIEIARLMLEAGADPDMRNGMDETPLIFCATTNSCPDDEAGIFAALLLSHGAAVTPRTE